MEHTHEKRGNHISTTGLILFINCIMKCFIFTYLIWDIKHSTSSEFWILLLQYGYILYHLNILQYWCQCIVLYRSFTLIICPMPHYIYQPCCRKVKAQDKKKANLNIEESKLWGFLVSCIKNFVVLQLTQVRDIGVSWVLQQREFSNQSLCAAALPALSKIWK